MDYWYVDYRCESLQSPYCLIYVQSLPKIAPYFEVLQNCENLDEIELS